MKGLARPKKIPQDRRLAWPQSLSDNRLRSQHAPARQDSDAALVDGLEVLLRANAASCGTAIALD